MIIEISSSDVIDWNATTEEAKKVNQIACILKTLKGEIPFYRSTGISNDLIGKPINHIKPVLVNNVMETVHDNVSDVKVKTVIVEDAESTGDYNIKVVCEI